MVKDEETWGIVSGVGVCLDSRYPYPLTLRIVF